MIHLQAAPPDHTRRLHHGTCTTPGQRQKVLRKSSSMARVQACPRNCASGDKLPLPLKPPPALVLPLAPALLHHSCSAQVLVTTHAAVAWWWWPAQLLCR